MWAGGGVHISVYLTLNAETAIITISRVRETDKETSRRYWMKLVPYLACERGQSIFIARSLR